MQQRGLAAGVAAWMLVVLAGAGSVRAQFDERRLERVLRLSEPEEALRADAGVSAAERALIDVGGYHTFTFLNLQDSTDNSRQLLQYDTALYGRVSFDGAHNFFARARFRYQDFSPGDSFDGRGDRWVEPFVDRYWYEFDLARHVAAYEGRRIDGDLNVRVGRQFVDWGAGLALSEQLYAVRPTVVIGPHWSVEGLAGVTPGDESIIDFDISRADFDAKTKRGFFGGLLRYTFDGGQEVYAYGLRMEDLNHDQRARFGVSPAFPVDFSYNAWYVGAGVSGSAWGKVLYLGEAVGELGESASDPLRGAQDNENIRAVAARGQLTYLFGDAHQTQAQTEVILASGDSDRQLPTSTVGGNLASTADNGFNSLGFANTGLAFAPSLSNIVSARAGVSTFPFSESPSLRRLQAGVDGLVFFKYNHKGPIDEPTSAQSYLGSEADVFVNYRVLSDLGVSVRYGAFFPGAAVENAGGSGNVRQFVLFSVTVSF